MFKFPARFEAPLFALLLSGLMSLLVSGVVTWQSLGAHGDPGALWLTACLSSWLIAFPAVMVVATAIRKLAARCVQPRA